MALRLSTDRASEIYNGSPSFLGKIVATTTKNNHDTAAPFSDTAGSGLSGKVLLVQPDAACYILPGSVITATVTTANGVKLQADERVILTMTSAQDWIACVSVSGTTNLRIWELV